MSTDRLADEVRRLVSSLLNGDKVITIKTGVAGGKKIAIEDARRS